MSDEIKKYPKVVTGVFIFNDKGEVFLVRAPHWQNKLTIPGGHVEWRELAKDGAIREVKEETGLDIKELELLKVDELVNPTEYGKNQNHLIAFDYKAKLSNEDQKIILDEREGVEYFWIKPEDALERDDISVTIIETLKQLSVVEKKKGIFSKLNCKDCEKTKIEAEEYKNNWHRALADYKNLQREIEQRRSEWAQMSEVQIIEDFLPVYDNFKKAFAMSVANNTNSEVDNTNDSWRQGIGYIMKQFGDVLKAHNIEEIKTVGEKFNPNLHDAAGEDIVEGKEPGEIIREVTTGYKMGEKVIRAARVIVNK